MPKRQKTGKAKHFALTMALPLTLILEPHRPLKSHAFTNTNSTPHDFPIWPLPLTVNQNILKWPNNEARNSLATSNENCIQEEGVNLSIALSPRPPELVRSTPTGIVRRMIMAIVTSQAGQVWKLKWLSNIHIARSLSRVIIQRIWNKGMKRAQTPSNLLM